MEKFDLVIQGPYTNYTDEIVESYLELPFVNQIIVSCWEQDKESKEFDRVKFVRNKYPESVGTDNKNLQIVSSLNGLKECQSSFSMKMRSDQKYTYNSMMSLYDFFMIYNQREKSYQYDFTKPKNKIFVAGIFPQFLFCPRDHIFCGHTEDLIELFDIPLERDGLVDRLRKIPKERLCKYYDCFVRTETYIGSYYCANFDDKINKMILLPSKHLYDEAIYWYYAKEISDDITFSVFKSFPKSLIDFEWPNKSDFIIDEYRLSGLWYEDGF